MSKTPYHLGSAGEIKEVPLEQIRVINPRTRDRSVFASIVENISAVGLKRPVTLAPSSSREGGTLYDLVCGQGRLEAFRALGLSAIPAVIVDAQPGERYLVSLVENLARRRHSTKELLASLQEMADAGSSSAEIAARTGLDPSYVSDIVQLIKNGEERLIGAVEKGWLPITVAREISRAKDADVQIALMTAYESGVLRGEGLMKVRRLVDRRSALGKDYGAWRRRTHRELTPKRLLATYQREVRRQQSVARNAEVSEKRLLFVVTALRQLLRDDNFRTLLRAEGIIDMPKGLADRLSEERAL